MLAYIQNRTTDILTCITNVLPHGQVIICARRTRYYWLTLNVEYQRRYRLRDYGGQ